MEFIVSKLSSVGPFFLLLGILIFIHEWGHFIVARICGVRVETFSLGFGPKIFKKKWGDTEYCLSVIPLGGYVKMYGDGTEDIIPLSEQKESFNHQSVLEKIAIVAAGPIMNLIFAFFLFLLLGTMGTPEVTTQLGDITKNSAAFNAGLRYGDTIKSVNGVPIKYYNDFTRELSRLQNGANARLDVLKLSGEIELVLAPVVIEKNKNPISNLKRVGSIDGLNLLKTSSKVGIDYQSPLIGQGAESVENISSINSNTVSSLHELIQEIEKTPPSKDLVVGIQKNIGESLELRLPNKSGQAWSFQSAGFIKPELMIGQVQRGSPAEKSGLKSGDQILEINGNKLSEWKTLVDKIKSTEKGQSANMKVANKNGVRTIIVTPNQTELLTATGQVEYRPTIGVAPSLEYLPPPTVFKKVKGFKNLIYFGAERSVHWTKVTLSGFKKLLTGEVSHKTLSGVISIGKVAKDSLDIGWSYFIKIMAIISINLFLLNLFPIPVLDGGHLLFYFAEVVKGSPISLRTRLIGQQIGVVLILSLVVYTIFNDFSRIVFSGW